MQRRPRRGRAAEHAPPPVDERLDAHETAALTPYVDLHPYVHRDDPEQFRQRPALEPGHDDLAAGDVRLEERDHPCHAWTEVRTKRIISVMPDVRLMRLTHCRSPLLLGLAVLCSTLNAATLRLASTATPASTPAAAVGSRSTNAASATQISETTFWVVKSRPRSNPQTAPSVPGGRVCTRRCGTWRQTCGVRLARSAAPNSTHSAASA